MNINEIKELLKTGQYIFLNNIPNVALLTIGGSYAYGTNVETSDVDIRGICLNPSREILTMKLRDNPYEDPETDTTIYPFKQIITLLTNCNPNVVEILGTKEEHLFKCNWAGRLLRDNAALFLSQKAIGSFGGYATAQLRRLQNALARDSYPQAEKEEHILDSINVQMEHLQRTYSSFSNENVCISLDESEREDMDKEIFIDVNFSKYPLRDLSNLISEMNNVVKEYSKLNNRNKKKDELHLNKHAMHLIRVLLTGTEILEGKGINTYRGNDVDFLLKIRNGEYSYAQIFEMVDEYDVKFKYAAANTCLPGQPDYKRIDEIVILINEKVLRGEI